ncbi:MAG: hypothetical protein IPO19_00360 [Rhodoferax sp.]|nr:hypothetical protein [Rhodoferax sp.]
MPEPGTNVTLLAGQVVLAGATRLRRVQA